MTKTMLMKKGEFLKERRTAGKLFQNVIKTKEVEANVTYLLPGTQSQFFKHKGCEIHIMIRGEVEFHIGEEKFILQEGDMLYHKSNLPHRPINLGSEPAMYVTVSTPPTFM